MGIDVTSIDEATLRRIERQHDAGVTSAEILDFFATHDVALSEATLRKYVQLGLLPRSVRVGRKGKHQGSQGIYPVGVVRQILRIKSMMAQSYTIEQIQKEFLFMRSDLQLLEQTLSGVFRKIGRTLKERKSEGYVGMVTRQVRDARALSTELMSCLESIENRLTARPRMDHAAVS
jgi:hypothetical protein